MEEYIPLEDRYKKLSQEYMDNCVCIECGAPIIATVSPYPHTLIFDCTNQNCICHTQFHGHGILKWRNKNDSR